MEEGRAVVGSFKAVCRQMDWRWSERFCVDLVKIESVCMADVVWLGPAVGLVVAWGGVVVGLGLIFVLVRVGVIWEDG